MGVNLAQYAQMLSSLRRNLTIKALALVDREGNIIQQFFPESCDPETVSTTVTSTLTMGENILRELGRNQLKQFVIKGKEGFIVIRPLNEELIFLLFTGPTVPLASSLKEIELLVNQSNIA